MRTVRQSEERPASDSFVHDAFISYSRKDTSFVAMLERVLKRYRPPRGMPVPQRRLDVFRDQEDFTGVEYSQAVEHYLRGSRKLIVVCSPHARESKYVNDEIRRFVESHTPDNIISVIVAGVPNNEAKPGDSAAAFPAELCDRLDVPLASDYRGFNVRWHRPSSRRFRSAWYKLLADIYGRSRSEIEERERRRRFRQRVVWTGGSGAVAAIIGMALYAASYQGRIARSNELAGKAIDIAKTDPEAGTLVALEAVNQSNTSAATSALRVNMAGLPDMQVPVASGAEFSAPRTIVFAPDGGRMFIADKDGKARVVDLQSARTVLEIVSGGKPITSAEWSPDGKLLAMVNKGANTIVYETATGKRILQADGELHWRPIAGTSGFPAVVVGRTVVQAGELDPSGAWVGLHDVTPRGSAGGQLSPDTRFLATLADGRLTVTDLDSGRVTSRAVDFPSDELFWSPKGQYLVGHSLMGFAVVDARSLATVFKIDAGNEIIVEDMSVSPDDTRLAGTDRGGSTSLWEIKAKKKIAELEGQGTRAYKPTFSSDGEFLSVIYANGRAALFRTHGTDNRLLMTFDAIEGTTAGEIVATDFTPDAKALVVEYENSKLAFWRTDRLQAEHRLPLEYGDDVENVRVTADGAVVGIEKGNAWRRWDTASGAETSRAEPMKALPQVLREKSQVYRPLPHEATVLSEVISPDGACILTASAYRMASGEPPTDANVVRLWEAETGTLLRQWDFDSPGPDAAFFAGRDRVVALYNGEAYVYRTSLCEPLNALLELARTRVSRTLTAEEQIAYLGASAPRDDATEGKEPPPTARGAPTKHRRTATTPVAPSGPGQDASAKVKPTIAPRF